MIKSQKRRQVTEVEEAGGIRRWRSRKKEGRYVRGKKNRRKVESYMKSKFKKMKTK